MPSRDYLDRLWRFHSENFFDFEKALTASELRYIETCHDVIAWTRTNRFGAETSPFGYEHFSSFSYSHRVDGERANSSRIAFGSVTRPHRVRPAALEVIEERGVTVEPLYLEHPASFFYGIGWDVEADEFKVYFRVIHDQFALPSRHARLLDRVAVDIRPEILVSFTFTGDRLTDEKVYAYPTARSDDAADLQVALMLSSARGLVEQVDVRDTSRWAGRLNETGRRIIGKYLAFGDALDTIAFQSRESYTLYFP
jgi:hypothetical protein